MVLKNLSVCLSVMNFDLNYLRTGKIEVLAVHNWDLKSTWEVKWTGPFYSINMYVKDMSVIAVWEFQQFSNLA